MLSFIIPAHNEEALLGRCLSSIRTAVDAVDEPHEAIVVDDASTDATQVIAHEHGASVVRVEHRQISATRNAGAREAKGDVLFFVDADTLVTEAVIRSAMRAIGGGAAGGGCVPRFDGRLPLWFLVMHPVMVFAMRRVLRQTGGACLFCTRRGFEATGGFSEAHYAAEEDVWVKSLKGHGEFVVLAEPVVTSGRSLRTQSFWSITRVFLRLALRGPDGFRKREGLDLWYHPQREKTQKS
jgi:glycosyltransferase involved in cell wall biosynthesis